MATLCYSLAEKESNTALVSLTKECPKELAKMFVYQSMKNSICPFSRNKKTGKEKALLPKSKPDDFQSAKSSFLECHVHTLSV